MKYLLLSLITAFSVLITNAQDAYHNDLGVFLDDEYSLPPADWVFFNTEIAIYNDAFTYGASSEMQDETDMLFSKKVHFVINQAGNNAWDAGWGIRNNVAIQSGDKLLAVLYLRSVGGAGIVNFFVEHATNFNKEVYLSFEIDEEWRRYLIPFEAVNNYGIDGLSWGFHLASQAQTVEVGGFTALNYDNDVALLDLPNEINNEFYDGYEADAPWRAEAASRIEELRKANLTIQTNKTTGDPIENAGINVNMLRHEFGFGTAVTANRIAGNNAQNVIYENKLINLDGEGNGFNCVVFENDLKWDAWEEEWFVNKPELVNAVQWLKDQDMKIRGHNLVWPNSQYLPNDIGPNLNNLPYVQNRMEEHIEEILTYPGLAGEIEEWDVLNEIVANTDIADAFAGSPGYPTGREIYVDIFDKAREVGADIGLWLNDYITIGQNQSAGSVQYDELKQYTQELINGGADLEGIGFQGHVGGSPTGIPNVLGTLDDFYDSFGTKAKITEFDMPSFVTEDLGATYMTDFMRAIFSHPSVDGFLFWNFWDGATWMNGGTNLYRLDWSETPAHAAFVDLLFNEWWTEEVFVSTADGSAEESVFKGLYEISYECDGNIIRDTINIIEATTYTIECDNLSTDIKELNPQKVKIFPNPAQDFLKIEQDSDSPAEVRLVDISGKVVFQGEMNSGDFWIDLESLKGIYFLEVVGENGVLVEKVIVE